MNSYLLKQWQGFQIRASIGSCGALSLPFLERLRPANADALRNLLHNMHQAVVRYEKKKYLEYLLIVYTFVILIMQYMKTISLKLDDSVFTETEQVINHIKKSRNRYINDALDFYNKYQKRKLLASRLENESKLVRDESLNVLHEFEMIDYES